MDGTQGGVTLVELLAVMAVAALLAMLAWPWIDRPLRIARRGEALLAFAEVGIAEVHWRASHDGYATLSELGYRPRMDTLAYRVVVTPGGEGYTLEAFALGGQARDTACRWLWVRVESAAEARRSGAAPDAPNDAAGNDRCWGR